MSDAVETRTVIAIPHRMPAEIWRFYPRAMDREKWNASLDDLASYLEIETLDDIAYAARYIHRREHQWAEVSRLLAQAVAEEFDEIDVRVCRGGHSLQEKAKTFPDEEAVDQFLVGQLSRFTAGELVEGSDAIVLACVGSKLFEKACHTSSLQPGFTDEELGQLVADSPVASDEPCVHLDVDRKADQAPGRCA